MEEFKVVMQILYKQIFNFIKYKTSKIFFENIR
jgi:hypothetical protein